MPAEKREKILGIPTQTWDKIELGAFGFVIATSLRGVMEQVGKKGLFGVGKSKKVAKFSRFGLAKGTWTEINTLSAVLGLLILLKSGIDLLEAKTNIFKTEISPGEGLFTYYTTQRK
jgi:hypothetical protein